MSQAKAATPSRLEREMFRAMRDLLGDGYIPDYYEQEARPFIRISQEHCAELLEALDEMVRVMRANPQTDAITLLNAVQNSEVAIRNVRGTP